MSMFGNQSQGQGQGQGNQGQQQGNQQNQAGNQQQGNQGQQGQGQQQNQQGNQQQNQAGNQQNQQQGQGQGQGGQGQQGQGQQQQQQGQGQQAAQNQNAGFGGQQMQQNQNQGFGGQNVDQGNQNQAPAPVDPTAYTPFILPAHLSGQQNDEAVQAGLRNFAQEAGQRGFDQKTAQAALDLLFAMDGHGQKRGEEAMNEQREEWKTESAQKGLLTQDSLMAANAGLMALDPKGELRKLMNEQGLTEHPALIQAFAAFHSGRNQPAMVVNGMSGDNTQSPGGATTLANALYPNMR